MNQVLYSFRLLPTYTAVAPTPSTSGTYTSAEYGFTISYPAGWMETPPYRPEYVVALGPPEQDPSVSVSVERGSESASVADYVAGVLEGMPTYWPDFHLVSGREVALGDGIPAYEIVFTGTMGGYALTCKYLIVLRGPQAFWIMGVSMPARFDQNEPVLDQVLYSFRLEPIIAPTLTPTLTITPTPTPVVDQSYEPDSTTLETDRLDKAQAFIVGITGTLVRVEVDIARHSGAESDLLFDIRPTIGGVPIESDDMSLVSVRIPADAVPTTRGMVSIDLSSLGVSVTAGEVLAIVLRSNPDVASYSWFGTHTINGYAPGHHYFRHPPAWPRPRWTSAAPGDDMGFRTFVVPESPSL